MRYVRLFDHRLTMMGGPSQVRNFLTLRDVQRNDNRNQPIDLAGKMCVATLRANARAFAFQPSGTIMKHLDVNSPYERDIATVLHPQTNLRAHLDLQTNVE